VNAAGVAADPAWPADALEIGRIVDAWGIKGWLKVQPFASDARTLLGARRWFIAPPESAAPVRDAIARLPSTLDIAEARPHGDVVVARAEGVSERSAAEALRGARIFIARSSFPAAADDEYYWVDLIGLAVVNRQGDRLGVVSGLLDTGAHSVLRVRPDDAAPADERAERLIPFVSAYVDDVDLVQRRITVDWGLDF
jgi:16S rRNA processing protein RimM